MIAPEELLVWLCWEGVKKAYHFYKNTPKKDLLFVHGYIILCIGIALLIFQGVF